MNHDDMKHVLETTFGDGKFSRAEKQALSRLLEETAGERRHLSQISAQAFEMARDALSSSRDQAVLNWLEGVSKVVMGQTQLPRTSMGKAYFSPGPDCRAQLARMLSKATKSIDICVFTITDNHLSNAIADAHRRGVTVRVITDNDKAEDLGSDVDRLEDCGVPLKVDQTEFHMHHKFAIFDGDQLATGSYNWTRTAFTSNNENLMVVEDRALLRAFQGEFDQLWAKLP